MKKAILFVISIMAITIAISCKKIIITDKDPDTSITEKKWHVTAQTTNGKDTFEEDYYECDKDDYIIFHEDGSLTDSRGTILCDPADQPDIAIDGKAWRVKGDKLYFVLDLPEEAELKHTIKVQTATQLVLMWGEENGDNITTTWSTK